MFTPVSGMFSRSNPVAQGQLAAQTPQQMLEQVQRDKEAANGYQREGQAVEAEHHYKAAQELLEEVMEKTSIDFQTTKMFGAIYLEYSMLLKVLGRTAEAAILDQKEWALSERYRASSASSRKREVERGSSSEHLNKKNYAASHELQSMQRVQDTGSSNGIYSASMLQQQPVASSAEGKSAQVEYLFEKALLTLGSLELPNKPSLFLVYAHDNPSYGRAEAAISRYLIDKLSQIRVNLYSDQTPMGQPSSRAEEDRKEDGKLEDILTSQLCLLPTRLKDGVEPVDKVVVCCSEVLEKYLEWPHYGAFYQELQAAYSQDCEQVGTSAIRRVVKAFSHKARFHHVLTEMAFLQIRAEQLTEQHGIIPVSLTPKSSKQCLGHFIAPTTVRMEDISRFEEQATAGREMYLNQGQHLVLFKLIERLLVGSDEAKPFLDKLWQGYNKCISRLEEGSSMLGWCEFVKLVDGIFDDIQRTLHSQLALTLQQQRQQLKHQQEIELRSNKKPLAILGHNIEEEYFTAWEEPGEIQDGLAMYVAPHATTVEDKNTFFDLDEAVTAFLAQANDSGQKTQGLLLRGEAGSGKSTFNRHLARRLWRDYSAAPTSGDRLIPLYISLPTIDRPNKNLIGQYLSDKCGFSPEQIDALRASQRFILILDGYDEIPAEQRNLYADEKLDQWQAKILLSCRPEYLTEGYKNHLQPRGRSRVLLEYQLAPFSEQSIETYIHQYVEYTQAQWSAQDYQDRLARIPNIKELLGTPFLLKMALSVLPTLDEAQPGQMGLTRLKLYEQFVQTWFERSLARLDAIQSKLTETQKSAFYGLKEEGFIEHSQTFNTDFALAMSEAKTTVAEYSAVARRGMPQDKRYEAFLGNKDEEKNLLRFSALLTRQQQQYRFIHKSIQDYLVARAVWEELKNPAESSRDIAPLNWIPNVQCLWEELGPSVEVNHDALLNRFNLVEDAAIQRFLVERVEQDGALMKPLLAWIKASAQEKSVIQGSANAMTILVRAGVQFNEMDLKNIRIPGADLSFGVFDSSQLQGSDLSGVKLRTSWLREANLSGAQMDGVQFGEWPYLKEESDVNSCAYSPDGNTCAMGLENGKIRVYDTSSWEKIHNLEGHEKSVSSIAYSPNGEQIASGSKDQTIRLWDSESGLLRHALQGHDDSVSSVAYSPNGERIASGSLDHTVRLWDSVSGLLRHTLQGHDSSVSSVAYSPNGEQIASGSEDTTIRLWDSVSGVLRHTLQGHKSSVSSVAYSPNGEQIASGSWDKTVRLWDSVSGVLRHILQGHNDWVKSVAYSPNGEQIASGSDDQTVRLWDSVSGVLRHTLQGHEGWVRSVAYSPNGEQIASGSDDQTVRLWDSVSGVLHHILQGHDDSVNSVAYSPNGEQIASGSKDQTVWLWAVASGQCRAVIRGFSGGVYSVAWKAMPDNDLVTGSWDKLVRQWRVIAAGDEAQVVLRWLSPHAELTVKDTLIEGVEGLSEVNRALLKQRGANDGTLLSELA